MGLMCMNWLFGVIFASLMKFNDIKVNVHVRERELVAYVTTAEKTHHAQSISSLSMRTTNAIIVAFSDSHDSRHTTKITAWNSCADALHKYSRHIHAMHILNGAVGESAD